MEKDAPEERNDATWIQASKKMQRLTFEMRIPPGQTAEAVPRTSDSFKQEMDM